MGIFGKNKTKATGGARYKTKYFQARIRQARGFKRVPRLAPKAAARISFKPTSLASLVLRFLFFAIILAAGYFLVISDYFLVESVVVLGNIQVDETAVKEWILEERDSRYFFLVPKNHQLIISRSRLTKSLQAKSPYISTVSSIKRKWPNGLEVTLEERVPVAIWQSGGDYFYIDLESVIYEQLPASYATSTENYFRIVDTTNTPRQTGDTLGISSTLTFLNLVSKNWQTRLSTRLTHAQVTGKLAEDVSASSAQGWTVYFDLKSDVERQLKSLVLILNQEIPEDREGDLAYIDLRLPTAAYYCYLDEPCAVAPVSSGTVE